MSDIIKVVYPDRFLGNQTREFSLAEHGEKFADLAKEFAATNGGDILEEAAETAAGMVEKELIKCGVCLKEFAAKIGLAGHMRSHESAGAATTP